MPIKGFFHADVNKDYAIYNFLVINKECRSRPGLSMFMCLQRSPESMTNMGIPNILKRL
jgi:hypothetical protein